MRTPAIETPLGRALRTHRDEHKGCDRHCRAYLDITNRATASRRVYEGPRHPYSWLSVREAVNV